MSCESITPVAYRCSEVAALFGVTGKTVANWVRSGVLKGTVVGGTVLVYRDPVDRIVAEARAA